MTSDTVAPESTAVRVALWRALHVEIDDPPHVLDDRIGLELANPDPGWRARGDMNPAGTALIRASIVGRARFIEDLVEEQIPGGLSQYVILGAGLDSFAQRRPELAARLQVFEVDQPGPQAWKRSRLAELGLGVPDWLHLVPVNFESDETWWDTLAANRFDANRPAVVSSMGVSMYLTREATAATMRLVATLAPGSTLAMTFLVPTDLVEDAERAGQQAVEAAARQSGTPFISHYAPSDIEAMALDAGFSSAQHVSPTERYFAGRIDGLRPSSVERLLVARV